ncbi:MAG TPA: dihydroneopterin aldolase [Acidimicrobiales bacterium]|nr:dihydroneopterin aldolase [Acidimicrobiales bacterium]
MARASEPQPSDRIEIRGLRLLGTHGVLPEERTRPQPFEVDVDLDVSMIEAGRSDDLADTVDYAAVVDRIAAVVGGATSFMLLEALASAVADDVLAADDRVQAVALSIRKLQPPLAADLSTVGVRIMRPR